MKIILPFFILFIFFHLNSCRSQSRLSDSAIKLSVINANYTFYMPGGDMAKRFKSSNTAGIAYTFKTKSNFLFSGCINGLFGSTVNEKGIFDPIKTSAGYLITGQGLLEDPILEERGFDFFLKAGKLKPIFGPNPNSGIYFIAGGGFIQHRIVFKYTNKPIYQIEEDYTKGYDRLTNGFALYESIGYQFFSNNDFGSFHLAFEFIQGFTKNRRSWNFDTMEQDNHQRFDLLYGLNIGFDIPVYKKAPEKYYFK